MPGVNQELVKLAETDYKQAERVSKDKHTLSAVIRKRVPREVADRALTESMGMNLPLPRVNCWVPKWACRSDRVLGRTIAIVPPL